MTDRKTRILLTALEDIAHGRGMFGVNPTDDLTWAMNSAQDAINAHTKAIEADQKAWDENQRMKNRLWGDRLF